MSNNRELALAAMRAAPARVTTACNAACALGFLVILRMLFLSTLPLRKTIFFAGLMGFNFIFNGMSILGRKKSGYVMLVIFAGLPLLGSFAYSVQLYTLILTGTWLSEARATITAIVGTIQMCLIVYLYRNLFAAEVREYVWKQSSTEVTELNREDRSFV